MLAGFVRHVAIPEDEPHAFPRHDFLTIFNTRCVGVLNLIRIENLRKLTAPLQIRRQNDCFPSDMHFNPPIDGTLSVRNQPKEQDWNRQSNRLCTSNHFVPVAPSNGGPCYFSVSFYRTFPVRIQLKSYGE